MAEHRDGPAPGDDGVRRHPVPGGEGLGELGGEHVRVAVHLAGGRAITSRTLGSGSNGFSFDESL